MIVDRIEKVGELDVLVPLPDGDYAAHAVITDHWIETGSGRAGEQRRIEITMLEGEKIPFCEPDGVIVDYTVVADNIEMALRELIHQVKIRRANNNFTAKHRSNTREVQRVAETLHKVRLRRPDNTVIEVPANTRAIPIESINTNIELAGSAKDIIPLSDNLRQSFNVLGLWIEQCRGCVLYKPAPDATELHVAEVEAAVPAS